MIERANFRVIGAVALVIGALIGSTAAAAAAAPRVLLLGEVHDNRAGHEARLALLRERLGTSGQRPVLVLEQIDRERQAVLDAAQTQCSSVDCLYAALGIGTGDDASATWDWPLYRPLLQYALDRRLPLVAGNVSRGDASRAMRDGIAAVLDADTLRRHGGAQPPADIADAQFEAIVDGHCGLLPETVARSMIGAQIARDVWMAKALADGVERHGAAVLIAGNGHVRRDVGVPRWLPERLRTTTEVHGYIEGEAAAGEFDVVHRLPAQVRDDPCADVLPAQPQTPASP